MVDFDDDALHFGVDSVFLSGDGFFEITNIPLLVFEHFDADGGEYLNLLKCVP